jgi:hypothetical protein
LIREPSHIVGAFLDESQFAEVGGWVDRRLLRDVDMMTQKKHNRQKSREEQTKVKKKHLHTHIAEMAERWSDMVSQVNRL